MPGENQWWVYIVETECHQLYTGISTDVERRFEEHLSTFQGLSTKGAKYFRGHKPEKVVYREVCVTRSEASKREYEIKKMTKGNKRKLIECR